MKTKGRYFKSEKEYTAMTGKIELDEFELLCSCPSNIAWTPWEYMNDEERKKHPEAKRIGGYLAMKKADMQKWWDSLSESDKNTVMNLPNFDANIFKECTGIDVRGKNK